MGVELVLHLARRVVEQLDRVRREAAERLEEQRVDDVLLSPREVVVAPLSRRKPPPTERIGIGPGETGPHGSSELRAPPASQRDE